MSGFASHFENQTIREAQGWPIAEMLESGCDDIRILDHEIAMGQRRSRRRRRPAYLHFFYTLMGDHPGLSAWGGGWQGFDDSVAGWCSATGGPRRTAQRCGRTWLETIRAANDHYSSGSQLRAAFMYNTDSLDKSLKLARGSYVIEVKAWYGDGTHNAASHKFTVR